MPSCLLLHELTREQARIVAPDSLALFPVGATEQHGPHLPVGTDFLIVEHVARQAALEAAAQIPIVVVPTLPYGSSAHHLPFGGTMSLRAEIYYQVVYDLAESLVTGGFRRIFILNGHGGNHELVQLVARELALKYPVNVAAGSYWHIAWEALMEAGAHQDGRVPGHAGAYETSQMLALRPDLVAKALPKREGVSVVDPRRMTRPYRAEAHGAWQEIDGYTDSPGHADASKGKTYMDVVARAVAAALVEFYRTTLG